MMAIETPSSLDFEESLSDKYVACRSLIEFELPENLPRRVRNKENISNSGMDSVPVSKMLTDISNYYEEWMQLKVKVDKEVIEKCKEQMLEKFIHHVNVEEEIGTQELDETRSVLLEQKQNKGNVPKKVKRTTSKTAQETRNMHEAYKQLEDLSKRELKEDKTLIGLLEMDECVKRIHKTLMKGVLSKDMTPGGVFSTSVRYTEYNGERHEYPYYGTQEKWDSIISSLIDNYNGLMEDIKKDMKKKKGQDRFNSILDLFKLAGWFLYKLVSLHPFCDGNGRLCRLLASYVLSLISPFPSPIYNVYSTTEKSDYLDAIYKCRIENLDKPGLLTLIMLESNHAAWKTFLNNLKINNLKN